MTETLYRRMTFADGTISFIPMRPLAFASPVTGIVGEVWGGDWFDATGYGTYYVVNGAPSYHTGADLNRPNYLDAGTPVYAAAAGRVVFSGVVAGWQGQVVVIEHTLESGDKVWTRYAHVKDAIGLDDVRRGERIATIADYTPTGVKGDHLHYDVARIDLGAKPGDWPGADKARVLRDYYSPGNFHLDRSK